MPPPIQQLGPEALCFCVVHPCVCVYIRACIFRRQHFWLARCRLLFVPEIIIATFLRRGCVNRPLVHLFGHTHQSAEVMSKHGVLFSNGSQFGGDDVASGPNVIDVYVRPELPAKTKLYKLPVWKELEASANSTDARQQSAAKPSCSLQ